MMRLEGHILTSRGFLAGVMEIENGKVARLTGQPVDSRRVRDATSLLVPGFIDLHVHGGGGRDVMEGADAAIRIAEVHARHGTTSLLATTMTAPGSDLEIAFDGLRSAMGDPSDRG